MKLKRYSEYVSEALGIADPTLKISDLVLEQVFKEFSSFRLSGESEINKKVDIKVPSLIRSSADWKKFPVKEIELTVDFVKLSNEEYVYRYPATAKIKNFNTIGSCSDIVDPKTLDEMYNLDDYSIIDEKGNLSLKVSVGVFICDKYNDSDYKDLKDEFESTVLHEFNHAYESIFLYKKGQAIPTGVTHTIDIHPETIESNAIPREVWRYWCDDFSFLVYWSEGHEIRAMIQEAYPYVKKYSIEEFKVKCPTYRYFNRMLDFNGDNFKQGMRDRIEEFMPGVESEGLLEKLIESFASDLVTYNTDAGQVSSLNPDKVINMTFDEFVDFCEERIHAGGEKIRRGVFRLYAKNK